MRTTTFVHHVEAMSFGISLLDNHCTFHARGAEGEFFEVVLFPKTAEVWDQMRDWARALAPPLRPEEPKAEWDALAWRNAGRKILGKEPISSVEFEGLNPGCDPTELEF